MSLWIRLPEHPNIVPFDRIVVDELDGRIVGFTTTYISGGTLKDNQTRKFKLKWLKELIGVIDDLNLKFGVSHQDVAPRNLLINEETDSLMLFDFNYSACIGIEGYVEERNDVKGVYFTMYEIITRDMEPRSIRYDHQHLSSIMQKEWMKHPDVELDHPVSEFRKVLTDWFVKRDIGKIITINSEAPISLNWPALPSPTLFEPGDYYVSGGKWPPMTLNSFRRKEWGNREGYKILDWQRPPQAKLISKDLANIAAI